MMPTYDDAVVRNYVKEMTSTLVSASRFKMFFFLCCLFHFDISSTPYFILYILFPNNISNSFIFLCIHLPKISHRKESIFSNVHPYERERNISSKSIIHEAETHTTLHFASGCKLTVTFRSPIPFQLITYVNTQTRIQTQTQTDKYER